MNLIDRQIETIAKACAVTTELVRLVVDGGDYRAFSDKAVERVRAALNLIGYIAPIPLVAMPVTVRGARELTVNGVPGIAFHDPAPLTDEDETPRPTVDDQWAEMSEEERAQWRHDNGPGMA
jgi:hypothetical protein